MLLKGLYFLKNPTIFHFSPIPNSAYYIFIPDIHYILVRVFFYLKKKTNKTWGLILIVILSWWGCFYYFWSIVNFIFLYFFIFFEIN